MLSSASEAEDLAQDVWLRWQAYDRAIVRADRRHPAVHRTRRPAWARRRAKASSTKLSGDEAQRRRSSAATKLSGDRAPAATGEAQ
nr:hypothetical protein [Actinoplanes siamensis]